MGIIEGDVEPELTRGESNCLVVEMDTRVTDRVEAKVHGGDIVKPQTMEIDASRNILVFYCVLDDGTEE